jgi:hypothetical protein
MLRVGQVFYRNSAQPHGKHCVGAMDVPVIPGLSALSGP